MLYLIATIIFSFLCGGCTIALAILYAIYKFRDDLFVISKKPQVKYERSHLNSLLHDNLRNGGSSALGEKESCRFANVLLAFIFREWRDTNQFQKWVLKKINIEFMEFMETKTASRLLEGLKVHDVNVGTNFPVFHSAKIKEPFSFTNDELPETVVLELDMEYHGGFFLAIDVDLVFGKTAFLSVKVTHLKGRVRLHFSRQPCTHWSISFLEEPDVKFEVETSFETRQLPQLTSLIVNQIRRTLRRKHTFPRYKMRYNPLFSFQHPEPSPFDGFIGEIPIQPAVLEVCVAAATRLLVSPKGEKERNTESPNYVIFATVSVNVKSCVGVPLLNHVSTTNLAEFSESKSQPSDPPTTSKSTQANHPKTQITPLDSLQRSLLGLRKDSAERAEKTPSVSKLDFFSTLGKEDSPPNEKDNTTMQERKDSILSTGSSAGPSYVMVALNFGATLREELRESGQKVVIVENITEHNDQERSGMMDGDTVVELNGVTITSLSQAIATIERIRANKESFKFKVKRNRPEPDLGGLDQNENVADSDKSNTSLDTESDHSDVDLEDYKDFVNISLQVAELHLKEGALKRRTASVTGSERPEEDWARPHSSSLNGPNDSNTDAPYMTLVSALTPTTSLSSLKEPAAGDKQDAATSLNKQHKKPEKETTKRKFDVNKIISQRSRSESPPFFRKGTPLPRNTSPLKRAQNTSEKGNSTKTDTPQARDSSPARAVRGNSPAKNAGSSVPAQSEGECSLLTTENLSYARVDDDPDSQLYKTSLENSNQREYSWNNEKFLFYLKERHRYLNIRYWAQQVGRQGIIKAKPPQIIGCVSVPLCELEMHCRGVSSRRVIRRFPLSAPLGLPHDHKWFLNDPVGSRPSFREQYCYGDTTLTLKLVPTPGNKNNSSNYRSIVDSAGTYYPNDETNGMITKEMLSKLSRKTGSDYLLTAATPKGRKLLVSRQTQTLNKNNASPKKTVQNEPATRDEPSTSSTEPKDESAKAQEKLSLAQLLKGLIPGTKSLQEQKSVSQTQTDDSSAVSKSDDVTVGVITNKKTGLHRFQPAKFSKPTRCLHCRNKLWTKSGLQCTACDAICHNRCVEKFKKEQTCAVAEPSRNEEARASAENLDNFIVLDTDADDNASDSDGLPTAAVSFRKKILDMTSSSQPEGEIIQGAESSPKRKKFPLPKNSEDLLAVNAKEMGKDLHRDLPITERKKMLEGQTQKVENELHSEITEKERLLREQKSHDKLSYQWKKLEKKLTKSDERLQALALLLLHYRAGLEDCDFETTEEGLMLSDDDIEKLGDMDSESLPKEEKQLNDVTKEASP